MSTAAAGKWALGAGYLSMHPILNPVLNQFHGDAAAAAALARLQPYYQQLSLLCLLSRALNEIDSCTNFFLMLPFSS
jgi:hypothetical protein